MTSNTPSRCGFITLVGAPNAGKSTLLNKLVGCNVSIVSPKVQTTRTIINGIAIHNQSQLIFIDTPGIFAPKKGRSLENSIVKTAWSGFKDGEIMAILIDVKKGICKNTKLILRALTEQNQKAYFILNKIDLIPRAHLLSLAQELQNTGCANDIFMVSALTGDGVDDIKEFFAKLVPEGGWLYAEDQVSSAPLRFLAAEMTRESLFYRLEDELPYAVSVETEQWEETTKGINIHQVIYVMRDSQKYIILGKGGQQIKAIGIRTRESLEKMLERKVNLFLFVKVRPNWINHPELFENSGMSDG